MLDLCSHIGRAFLHCQLIVGLQLLQHGRHSHTRGSYVTMFVVDTPSLKSFVDCFLLVPNKLLHLKIFSWIRESGWTLHVLGMFTMIDVISLHSLILGKVRQEAISEDLEIIVGSTGIGPIDPHHISSHDAQADFIPNRTLLELAAVELKTFSATWKSVPLMVIRQSFP